MQLSYYYIVYIVYILVLRFLPSSAEEHICNVCHKHYNHRQSLRKHVRIVHEEIRSAKFNCAICGISHTDRHRLRAHIQDVHRSVQRHPCLLCVKIFKHKRTLNSHMKKKHPEFWNANKDFYLNNEMNLLDVCHEH